MKNIEERWSEVIKEGIPSLWALNRHELADTTTHKSSPASLSFPVCHTEVEQNWSQFNVRLRMKAVFVLLIYKQIGHLCLHGGSTGQESMEEC